MIFGKNNRVSSHDVSDCRLIQGMIRVDLPKPASAAWSRASCIRLIEGFEVLLLP
jgi:hypothetical protein